MTFDVFRFLLGVASRTNLCHGPNSPWCLAKVCSGHKLGAHPPCSLPTQNVPHVAFFSLRFFARYFVQNHLQQNIPKTFCKEALLSSTIDGLFLVHAVWVMVPFILDLAHAANRPTGSSSPHLWYNPAWDGPFTSYDMEIRNDSYSNNLPWETDKFIKSTLIEIILFGINYPIPSTLQIQESCWRVDQRSLTLALEQSNDESTL